MFCIQNASSQARAAAQPCSASLVWWGFWGVFLDGRPWLISKSWICRLCKETTRKFENRSYMAKLNRRKRITEELAIAKCFVVVAKKTPQICFMLSVRVEFASKEILQLQLFQNSPKRKVWEGMSCCQQKGTESPLNRPESLSELNEPFGGRRHTPRDLPSRMGEACNKGPL